MPQRPALESFIVRIYKVDAKDRRKIQGLVEAMDGSGRHESFAGIDELGFVLNLACLRTGEEEEKVDGA
jgi:hypothetical protein